MAPGINWNARRQSRIWRGPSSSPRRAAVRSLWDTTRDRLADLTAQRQPLYEDVSAVAVDTDGLSPEEVAEIVVSFVVDA